MDTKHIKVNQFGDAERYCNPSMLPDGAELLGTVSMGPFDVGALVRLANGEYVKCNCAVTTQLPQDFVDGIWGTELKREFGE